MGSSPPGHLRSIPETTLRGVLARYGLDNDVAIVPMEASKRNDNFVVQGTGGKWVLRRYRRNNDEARVRFQLRFQQHLSDSGFPTSEIIPSKTGDQLVCDESGLWSLFTFIQGNEFDFSRPNQVASAAQRLAQFHHGAATFDEPEVVFDVNLEWCDWWDDGDVAVAERYHVVLPDCTHDRRAVVRAVRVRVHGVVDECELHRARDGGTGRAVG